VTGNAFLRVVFLGGAAHDSATGMPTYTGPTAIFPTGLVGVKELRQVEDFEATLVWIIGLDQRRAFRVTQLDGPDRLVVDIGPPSG
jgi:hypothetical protein